MTWEKVKCCCEWDMAWFCDRCEKMMYWKEKGWRHDLRPYSFYCDKCKEILERNSSSWMHSKKKQ